MSETSIQWTDYTFNPWWGCVRVSPGCENCYAESFSHRLALDLWGPKSSRRFFDDHHWGDPLRWAKRVQKGDARRLVFCASMADVFEGGRPELDEHRARLWRLIEATPELTWQLLTKRPENVLRMVPGEWCAAFPANVWMLTTCEDQARLDIRVPELLRIPARVRGISYEPALGRISFRWAKWHPIHATENTGHLDGMRGIHWVIVGGESGNGARPFNPAWAREVIEQCRDAGAAVFVKQLGARPIVEAGRQQHWEWGGAIGRDEPRFSASDPLLPSSAPWFVHLESKKGGDPAEWPESLRVREFPS